MTALSVQLLPARALQQPLTYQFLPSGPINLPTERKQGVFSEVLFHLCYSVEVSRLYYTYFLECLMLQCVCMLHS